MLWILIASWIIVLSSFLLGYLLGANKNSTLKQAKESIISLTRPKTELGAVRPITAEKLEERKHPEILEAKKAMEQTLNEINKTS